MKNTLKTQDSGFIRDIYKKYLIASVFSTVFGGIANIVNNALLGSMLSSTALSVAAICSPLNFVFSAAAALIVMGGVALCARYTGQGEYYKSDEVFTATMVVTFFVAIFISILLLIFRAPVVSYLCPEETLRKDVMDYYIVVVCGGLAQALGQVATGNFLRQDGKPTEATVINCINTVLSIGLCYGLLRSGLMGMPAAAVGQMAGSAFMAVSAGIIIWRRGSTVHFIKVSPRKMGTYMKEIVVLGLPCFFENASIFLRSFSLNAILATSFGTLSLATFGVIGSMINIHLMLIYGVAAAGLPFIGVFVAERDTASVRRILTQIVKKSALTAIPAMLLVMIFSKQIVGLFGLTDPAAVEMAAPAVRIFSLCFFPGMINYTLTALHMNNKRIALANVMMICRLFAYVLLPTILLKDVLGVNAVWHSFWISEVLTLITALVWQRFIAAKNKALSPITLLDQGAEQTGTSISIPVQNTKAGIAKACEAATAFCDENGVGSRRKMYLNLAAEEILLSLYYNALNRNPKAVIDLYILLDKGELLMRFRTAGKMYDPVTQAKNHKRATEAVSSADFRDITVDAALAACEVVQYSTTFGVNNLTVILCDGK